jgi:catechol 2,3-dioxygenase-like lactoylglutathione lyase family enzyme
MKVIVISGSMGAGKTTVMAEASDLLSASGIVHAAIDADTLGIAHLPAGFTTDLMYRNLEAFSRDFAAAGVNRLLLAQAVGRRGEIERIRTAVPGAAITVCRLTAGIETMRRRVRLREPGILQNRFLARVVELNAQLDDAHLEDFSLQNDGRSVTEVAGELLARAGWLSHVGPLPDDDPRTVEAVTDGDRGLMSNLELVALVVREYDPAIGFFVNRLGFDLVEDRPALTNDGRPKRWVVVRPRGGTTGILLARADGEHQTGIVGRQFEGRVGFFLRVDDFKIAYDRMVAAGVEFVSAPRLEPYGQVAVFLDLEGNRWDLLGPVAAEETSRVAD